jgi:hypothetical protein
MHCHAHHPESGLAETLHLNATRRRRRAAMGQIQQSGYRHCRAATDCPRDAALCARWR